MASKKAKNQASEVEEAVSTSASEVVKLTLDEYLGNAQVNPGLVASFRVEARRTPAMLEAKTAEEWESAFDLQSKTAYL